MSKKLEGYLSTNINSSEFVEEISKVSTFFPT